MKVVIDVWREGYGTDQVRDTMTVGELIDVLSLFEPDAPVYLGSDRQSYGWYTFGGVTGDRVLEVEEDEDEL